MNDLTKYFDGIDPLVPGNESIELRRNGKLYISLYHECKVVSINYESDFIVTLKKVTDIYKNSEAPLVGAIIRLKFEEAVITRLYADEDGNFEDIEEFAITGEEQGKIIVSIKLSGILFTLKTPQVSLG